MSQPLSSLNVQRARTLLRPRTEETGGWLDLPRIEGRLVEVSEAGFFGAVSAVCNLMPPLQSRQEQIAWIATGTSIFFPPDLAFRGVDVRAVTVVKAPGPRAGLQAADALVRSGAFALVVVDWGGQGIEEAVLGRLSRMAEDRQTTVVFLTRKRDTDPSLGTQVSLRGTVTRSPQGGKSGESLCQVTRDKRSGPPSRQRITFHGPFSLY